MLSCAGRRESRLANRTRWIARRCRRRPIISLAVTLRLQLGRSAPVQLPRVCRRPQTPLVAQRYRHPALRLRRRRNRFARRASRQMEAVTARQRPRSRRETTTTSSRDGYARQRNRRRIPPCARSCGRNTQTIARGRRRSDDRWRFVSWAVRAAERGLCSSWNTVRPFKALARNWTSGTCDGREDCLGLGCRAQMSNTGTSAAPSGPIRS